MPGRRVSTAVCALYALPHAAATFAMTLVLVAYMIYATDVLHLPAALAGAIFLVAKLWDAVSVPLAGQWSDATRSRLGRRRNWILASGPPMALFAVAMWLPPAGLATAALAAWVAASTLGFYAGFAAFLVPHMALGAELAGDAESRDRVFAARQLASSVGLLPAFFGAGALLADPETARAAAGRWGDRPYLTPLACGSLRARRCRASLAKQRAGTSAPMMR